MAIFKQLKYMTFDDRFRIEEGPIVWQLSFTKAVDNLHHLGQVCVTNGKIKRWVSWNMRVQVVV